MGSPGQGKSKLLELMIRHDIDEGHGCCLIDPSEQGSTAKKALNYAIERNYKKVVIIDAEDIQKYKLIPTINPIIYNAPLRAIKAHVSDSVRVLFNQKDAMFTTNINKYLPAVVAALYASRFTLHEAKYFLSKEHFDYQRKVILSRLPKDDLSRIFIEDTLKTNLAFNNFLSTVNRLIPFFEDTSGLMVSSNATDPNGRPLQMNFQKLIKEGYLILVVLEEAEWGEEQQRLLGTIVINQLIRAKQRLWKKGYKRPYYLYIDEVGQYATKKLDRIMNYERHINLRLTVAHQNMGQVEELKKTLKSSARTKILFYTADDEDRREFSRMLYGGDISTQEAAYALGELRKQNAVIRLDKQKPKITRLTALPDIRKTPEEIDAFKRQYIYNQSLNPFYRTKKQIEEEIKNRFDKASTKGTRPNATGPQHPIRQERPRTDASAGSVQDGANNETPTQPDAPVERGRKNRTPRKAVQREKGIPSSLLPKHRQDDEPV